MRKNKMLLEITSADISGILQELSNAGIMLYHVKNRDTLSFTCAIRRADYKYIASRVKQRGDHCRVIQDNVFHITVRNLAERPVIGSCIMLLLFMTLFLQGRILFVEVEGNQNVPAALILEKANENGLRLGATRKRVRSEQMKNSLLEAIPDLQWAGINTKGCVAVISVEERSETAPKADDSQVASVIAARDGRVISCIVAQGNPMCSAGQAVKEGQVLVSGYIDAGITVRAVKAEAEVLAQTIRTTDVLTPEYCVKRQDKKTSTMKISLLIGKKLINFNNGSGIPGDRCVKMYSRKYMTLPGGRVLPIALVITHSEQYAIYDEPVAEADADKMLQDTAYDYTLSQMVSGQILHAEEIFRRKGNAFFLSGEYICSEMIGRIRYEESIYRDGKDE